MHNAKDAECKWFQQKEEVRKGLLAEVFASNSEIEDKNEKSSKNIYVRQKSNSCSDWKEEEA
eukprot:5359116-Ditylum_brightwellii.AAC.1